MGDKDDILPGAPMEWTYEILSPENVKYEGGSIGWLPKYYFIANGNGGDIVMICRKRAANYCRLIAQWLILRDDKITTLSTLHDNYRPIKSKPERT